MRNSVRIIRHTEGYLTVFLQVLITIYWLGRAANSSASYNGPTLDLQEFEGLLSQMRKVQTHPNTHDFIRLLLEPDQCQQIC